MTAQPALPLHMCPMAYILSADCVWPVADAWPKCAYQQWPGELASSSSRARVGAVWQSRRTLYCSCTRCARLRRARRRCRAHACLPARLASLRHVHMWALPRNLAERYHDTVRVQTCSHACDLSSTCALYYITLVVLHHISCIHISCIKDTFFMYMYYKKTSCRQVLQREQGIIRTRSRAVSCTSTTTGVCRQWGLHPGIPPGLVTCIENHLM